MTSNLNSLIRRVNGVRHELKLMAAGGQRLAATTSLQTQSVPFLHIIAGAEVDVDIIFVDTGFHFPETWQFADQLQNRLSLKFIIVAADRPFYSGSTLEGAPPIPPYALDARRCCATNKIEPVRRLMANYDIWISGVRADQTDTRAKMERIEVQRGSATRFHPMLEWTQREVYQYSKAHDLPAHPLEAKGYLSIGCMPCTRPFLEGLDARDSRWPGLSKSECGLHTDLRSGTGDNS